MAALGYRSGFEERIAASLEARQASFAYEPGTVKYTVPPRPTNYRPDFVLPNGIIIEAKGWFKSKDRVKHQHIKKSHPDLDIRFVFQNSRQLLNKSSKTSYGMWCQKNGFPYASKDIPDAWLEEDSEQTQASLALLKEWELVS